MRRVREDALARHLRIVVLAVVGIAGITLRRGPDLPRGLRVPTEGDDARTDAKRRVGPRRRARARVRDRMRVDREVAYSELRQDDFHPRSVAALGKPDPFGPVSDLTLELPDRDADLGPPRRFTQIHERKEPVR